MASAEGDANEQRAMNDELVSEVGKLKEHLDSLNTHAVMLQEQLNTELTIREAKINEARLIFEGQCRDQVGAQKELTTRAEVAAVEANAARAVALSKLEKKRTNSLRGSGQT